MHNDKTRDDALAPSERLRARTAELSKRAASIQSLTDNFNAARDKTALPTPEQTADFLWTSRQVTLTQPAEMSLSPDSAQAARDHRLALEELRAQLQRGAAQGAPHLMKVLALLEDDPWWREMGS